jgi:transposase
LTPAKQGRRGGSRLDVQEDFIIGMIEEEKDITLNVMVPRLREDRAVSIDRSALDVWLRKRGWTFKKVRICTGARAF